MLEEFVSTRRINRTNRHHRFITTSLKEQVPFPAPLNYHGFPKSCCTSVNDVICHGIPNDKALKKGDTVNIDITIIKDGYYGDTSRMFFRGAGITSCRTPRQSHPRMAFILRLILLNLVFVLVISVPLFQLMLTKNHCSVVEEYCGPWRRHHFSW